MRDWKTTAVGVFVGIVGFIAFAPEQFGGEDALIVNFAQFTMAGGLAALGVVARDSHG